MSTIGTRGSQAKKQLQPKHEKVFVVVSVWRGFAEGPACYRSASAARAHYQRLKRKQDESDDVQLFSVAIQA